MSDLNHNQQTGEGIAPRKTISRKDFTAAHAALRQAGWTHVFKSDTLGSLYTKGNSHEGRFEFWLNKQTLGQVAAITGQHEQKLKWALDSRARWQTAAEELEAKLDLAVKALEDIANAGLGFEYSGFKGQQAMQKVAMVGLRTVENVAKEATK